MKILINALGAEMGGAMRHLTNFLPELGRATPDFEFVVLMRSKTPNIRVDSNVHLEKIRDSKASKWSARLVYDIVTLPHRLKNENFAATVSLLNFGPIWSHVPHILFQRNSLYYCDYFLEQMYGRLKLKTLMRRRLAVESMKRADLIVTPSHSMKEMILRTCPNVYERRFAVLKHGFNPSTMQSPLDQRISEI